MLLRVNSLFKHLTYKVFAPGTVLRNTYGAFQDLLAHDSRCHELMAKLESYYYQGIKEDFCKIAQTYHSFAKHVEGMVECLERMNPTAYLELHAYFRKFNFYAGFFLEPPALNISPHFVLSFTNSEITPELAGFKTTKLIEVGAVLGCDVPDGFVITTNCFSYLIEYNNLQSTIDALLARIELSELAELDEISLALRKLIEQMEIPADILLQIEHFTNMLQEGTGVEKFAVRSSAVAEDGECTFAGQYESCLNVQGDTIAVAYKRVLSSKYSPEALVYRISRGLYDVEAAMAVMVLPMVDPLVAGVMYTKDVTEQKCDTVSIHATKGLGEQVVSGTLLPDVYTLDKKTGALVDSQRENGGGSEEILSEKLFKELLDTGLTIEKHFQAPQDIEWAIDGQENVIVLQTRDLSHFSAPEQELEPEDVPSCEEQIILRSGTCGSPGMAAGVAHDPQSFAKAKEEKQEIILVLKETQPRFVKFLPHVAGVIARYGSEAGHFATVCREFKIPLLLGIGEDIKTVTKGTLITLDAGGQRVYEGAVQLPKTLTPAYETEKHLPFYRKLSSLLDFVTPLKLVDPNADDFVPEACRSLHDIIRFCHEKAVSTMFSVGDQAGRTGGIKKQLITQLPFDIYLVDIDCGIRDECAAKREVTIDDVLSVPFLPLWAGLHHPHIEWTKESYYDWKSYDQVAISDGFAFKSKNDSATYAIVGAHYVNINIRFGYHFTIVDALCEPDSKSNYCSLRFAGGGGDFEGRMLRIQVLSHILKRLDFEVTIQGDLLDASLTHVGQKVLKKRLQSLGHLLALSKQMDIHLHDAAAANEQIEQFFAGE